MALRSAAAKAALARVRNTVAEWPGVDERESHGSPAWFVGKRQIAVLGDNHHGDGRLALWCKAPPGSQAMLVEANPDCYFVPAYVGHLGWVGVRLDRKLAWREVAGALERAYEMAKPAPKRARAR